ncbi:MAG: phosphatase PAP2 family protein [Ilumatobacteraceae bacterium]
MALIVSLFVLYLQVRRLTSGDLAKARSNAGTVVHVERWFGVFSERSLQRAVLDSRFLIELLDHYYVFVHFSASFTFMAWVFLRHPDAWRRIRAWFLVVTLSGLAIHVAFPLAPPRMLASEGFVDTLHVYGPSIYSRDVTQSAANQLAAMPSLHFAWAVIVAAGFISIRRSRLRRLMVIHPAVTLLAIVATANHYWLDAAVGGVLVVSAVAVTRAVMLAAERRRTAQPVAWVIDPVVVHTPRRQHVRCAARSVPATARHGAAVPISRVPARAGVPPPRRASTG